MAKKSPVQKAIKKDSSQQSTVSDQIISRARELAWMGQHTKAIELATQELIRKTDWQSASRIVDLLDLRAESYLALGKPDLATRDTNTMVKIAESGKEAHAESTRPNTQGGSAWVSE